MHCSSLFTRLDMGSYQSRQLTSEISREVTDLRSLQNEEKCRRLPICSILRASRSNRCAILLRSPRISRNGGSGQVANAGSRSLLLTFHLTSTAVTTSITARMTPQELTDRLIVATEEQDVLYALHWLMEMKQQDCLEQAINNKRECIVTPIQLNKILTMI